MAQSSKNSAELMTAVPAALRRQVVSGMRWTFWLSVLAIPFSYGTSILLARAGPEVIGTYGLLMVYIGFVAGVMYLGGDAVVIKFIPELPAERRFSFLFSYFLVIIASLLVWLVPATIWPNSLHYLFGDRAKSSFFLWMLYASPIYIAFSVTVASLKSVLEMRWAHLMMRVLSIASFLLYNVLFFSFRPLLTSYYTQLIWGIYLCLTPLVTLAGVGCLIRSNQWGGKWQGIQFFLPQGFWRYTLSYQQACFLSFLIGQLDVLLVMNFGGVSVLGKYVVVLTFAETIRTANRFFSDTLFPSLTNSLALGEVRGASQLFAMNLRLLFVVTLGGACTLMALVDPIVTLFGPHYLALRPLLILMLLLYGLAAPGSIGSTSLMSVGRPQHTTWVNLGQLIALAGLFFVFWPIWQLRGAVLATGLASVLASLAFLAVAKRSTSVAHSVGMDYAKFAGVMVMVAAVTIYGHSLGLWIRLAVSAAGIAGFLLLAGYGRSECRALLSLYFPSRVFNLRGQTDDQNQATQGDSGTKR